MSSNERNADKVSAKEIVLRDLQSLLCKSIGKEVTVKSYETTNLLAQGENFASTMLKVEAVVKRTKNSEEEKLELVAKMIPTSEFHKDHFNVSLSLIKEIFVFEQLFPAFRQLEIEYGIENNILDILPKFYGGRLSKKQNVYDLADEDAVLLMENVKVQGYYTCDKLKGLDYEHTKLALTELARFHAMGMAVKYKNPKLFEEARKVAQVFPWRVDNHEFDDAIDHALKILLNDERIAKFEERIRKVVNKDIGLDGFIKVEAVEPWVTFIHGDFWVNNIMYQKDNSGKLSGIKFVDFQLSKVCSPLRDLPYFLCASVDLDVIDEHFHDLLDMYHTKLVDVLNKLGCDVSPFSKEKFLEQLRKDANNELYHCLMAIKFFTVEVNENTDLTDVKSNVMLSAGNEMYVERCWKAISRFVQMNWI